eukprot:6207039-Pleurochrysis_carterae.AAC.1
MVRRSDTKKLSVGRRSGKKASKELTASSIRLRSACGMNTWISVTDPSGLVVDERIIVLRVAGVGGIGAKAPSSRSARAAAQRGKTGAAQHAAPRHRTAATG